MRRFRSSMSLILCLAVIASMFSGFLVASAAPLKPASVACEDKPANLTVESKTPEANLICCLPEKNKVASTSTESVGTSAQDIFDCCEVTLFKVAGSSAKTQIGSSPVVDDDCCGIIELPLLRGKTMIGANPVQEDPCAPPVVDSSCGISYPAGSVVGEIPFNQQAYYAPGLAASGVTINAGTYWVTGLGKADNGDGYYQIVVACQFLFVPETDVIPSYQAPWSGQPLPTTPPVEN